MAQRAAEWERNGLRHITRVPSMAGPFGGLDVLLKIDTLKLRSLTEEINITMARLAFIFIFYFILKNLFLSNLYN